MQRTTGGINGKSMGRDDLYESLDRKERLLSRDELITIVNKVKNSKDLVDEVGVDDLKKWRDHTIELSYRIREKAIELCPDRHLGNVEFDEAYTKGFRELDSIELESMILSHEWSIHRRRPQTIKIIRDAYMNNLLMEDKDD